MKKIDSKTLVDGIIEYVDTKVIPNIDDNFLKIALKTILVGASQKRDVCEKVMKEYLKVSFIQDIFSVEDETFDIEFLIDSLKTAIDQYGDLKFTFPPVKFISPEEKTLSFNSKDLSDLKQVLINVSNREVKQ